VPLHGITRENGCTCRAGRACRRGGSHPFTRLAPDGVLDATDLECMVGHWFESYPHLNIGVVAGQSGLVVVEAGLTLIAGESGLAVLDRLVQPHGRLPVNLTAEVPGFLRQFFFADADGRFLAGRLARGVNVKAGDSIVVMPPSIHPTGQPSAWLNSFIAPDPAPDWLSAEAAP
jgi:hypothetical protein